MLSIMLFCIFHIIMNSTKDIINLCKDTKFCDAIKRLIESLLVKSGDIKKTVDKARKTSTKCAFTDSISLKDEIESYNLYIQYVNEVIKSLIEFINECIDEFHLSESKIDNDKYNVIYINLTDNDKLFICNYKEIITLIESMINNLVYYESEINDFIQIIDKIIEEVEEEI